MIKPWEQQTFSYAEVKKLLSAERDRAVKIAYSFKDQNEKSYESRKSAGSTVAFVPKEIANECRLVGNAISGLNALSSAFDELSENLIENDLKSYLVSRELSATYIGDQTPAERLRNCLSPYTTLVQLLFENEKYVKVSFWVDEDKELLEIIHQTIELCKNSNKDVKAYLSDIEQFYSK